MNINQFALSVMGSNLDVEDAILIDYLYWLCASSSKDVEKMRKTIDGERYTWFNYSFYLKENPIIRGKTKSSITPRIKKLEDEGFISTHQDEKTYKKYVKILQKTDLLFRGNIVPVQKTERSKSEISSDRSDKGTVPFRNLNIDNNIKDTNCLYIYKYIYGDSFQEPPCSDSIQIDSTINQEPNGIRTRTVPKIDGVSKSKKPVVIKTEEESLLESDIRHLLSEFNKFNPGVGYKNMTHRKSLATLLSIYSVDDVKSMMKHAFDSNGKEFAPVITTPTELLNKLTKLEIFLGRKK